MGPSRLIRALRAAFSVQQSDARPRGGSGVSCSAELLEERVLMAAARAQGLSGYSGTLSTNTSIRQQQLICDPDEPVQGSTSVSYDASKVTLLDVQPGPGYGNESFQVLVEVLPYSEGESFPILVPLNSVSDVGFETGYVQIRYVKSGEAGQVTPDEGYTIVDEGGVDGVDTNYLYFALRSEVPDDATVSYTIFAAPAGTHSNNEEDFLAINDADGNPTIIFGPDDLSPAFVSTDTAPTVAPLDPITVLEGADGLALHASATDAETPATDLVYQWDINGDGSIDATGADVSFTAAQLADLGLADGPKTVSTRLDVTDATRTVSSTTTLTVQNVAPTASVTGANAFLGKTSTIIISATDPSAADSAAGFKYRVNWGDGTGTQTIQRSPNNGGPMPVEHVYNTIGAHTVTVLAIDKNNGISDPVTAQVAVRGAVLRPDPSCPSKLSLFVSGTNGNDTIRFNKIGGDLQVVINGKSAGTFKKFERIFAYGLAGNDDIRMNAQGSYATLFFGGSGADTLVAGNGPSILTGEKGDDCLIGGNGRDLLIGGFGSDTLHGGNGDDILVGGKTSYDSGSDASIRALTSILDEWSGGGSYETRIGRIMGTLPGGLDASERLRPGQTVFDDIAADDVRGENGRDWLFIKRYSFGVKDRSDLAANETGTEV